MPMKVLTQIGVERCVRVCVFVCNPRDTGGRREKRLRLVKGESEKNLYLWHWLNGRIKQQTETETHPYPSPDLHTKAKFGERQLCCTDGAKFERVTQFHRCTVPSVSSLTLNNLASIMRWQHLWIHPSIHANCFSLIIRVTEGAEYDPRSYWLRKQESSLDRSPIHCTSFTHTLTHTHFWKKQKTFFALC